MPELISTTTGPEFIPYPQLLRHQQSPTPHLRTQLCRLLFPSTSSATLLFLSPRMSVSSNSHVLVNSLLISLSTLLNLSPPSTVAFLHSLFSLSISVPDPLPLLCLTCPYPLYCLSFSHVLESLCYSFPVPVPHLQCLYLLCLFPSPFQLPFIFTIACKLLPLISLY